MKRRMKKSKGPKKVSYWLIPRDWSTEAERVIRQPIYRLLDELVREYHEELKDARIVCAWALSWKPDADGRVTLGKCKKASELDRELSPYDFVILLSKDFWMDLHVSPEQRKALLDHELTHAAVSYDERGEPKVDEKGRIVYRVRRHDLEEFSAIAERYGCWKKDIEGFADALRRARRKARGWIGFTDLHDTLKDIGVTIAFDRVRSWSDRERREVMTWALLYHDEKDAGRVTVSLATAPACLQEAVETEALAGAKEAAARLAEACGPGSSMSFGLVGQEPVTLTPDDAPRLREEARALRGQDTQ